MLERHGHNFIRLWAWEQAAWHAGGNQKPSYSPMAYARTGPGLALDGKPKFDLTKFDRPTSSGCESRRRRASAASTSR
jgi:hypothetical protein